VTRAPRLVARTIGVTFVTVAAILTAVFVVLTLDARARVRSTEIAKMEVAERAFAALESERTSQQLAAIATVAENPTLKAAMDTYFTESEFSGLAREQEATLRDTVTVEAKKLAALTAADVLAIADPDGRVFTSAGPLSAHWPAGAPLVSLSEWTASPQGVIVLPGGAFRYLGAPLRFGEHEVGALVIGTALDAGYAGELAALSGSDVAIAVRGSIVASTLPAAAWTATLASAGPPGTATHRIDGREYAVQTLLASDQARIVTLASIDAGSTAATRDALGALAMIALGAFALAAFGSFWLAHVLSSPIDRLSREIEVIVASRDLTRPLRPTGTSRELDSLAQAFNDLTRAVSAAETDTRAAYVGSIRALAAMLDERDPYTAGHSERVSDLSLRIGRELHLGESDLEVLRLGALLHDIGKIGVSDAVLSKPSSLTADEYEHLKRHPAIGARILRQLPFLAPHVPIVELHHERPDGRGYPFGLRGHEIPLAAQIVHVADAFDAITSARAYRSARTEAQAVEELVRWTGTDFDPACVTALLAALHRSDGRAASRPRELLEASPA
jgi:putative nucleotidyltransferase with HDIG domain